MLHYYILAFRKYFDFKGTATGSVNNSGFVNNNEEGGLPANIAVLRFSPRSLILYLSHIISV